MSARRGLAATLTALLVLSGLAVAAGPAPTARAAADDCGFSGAVNTFDGDGGAIGNWNNAAMWDTGSVPYQGQVCIPVGKTAVLTDYVTLIGSFGGQTLRIQGTLQVSGIQTAAAVYGSSVIENTGTLDIQTGGQFRVGAYDTTFKNLPGGVVKVATGGSLSSNFVFQNLGGTVDLSGGGTFTLDGPYGVFEQGQSSDVVPVQGTVTGGSVTLAAGKFVGSGTGVGAFVVPPGASPSVSGTLGAAQSITVSCSNAGYPYLRVTASESFTNNGTITFAARPTGSICESNLWLGAGATFTNTAQLNFNGYTWITGDGSGQVLNGSTGTITVSGTAFGVYPLVASDGAIVVNPGGTLAVGNNSQFELRDGTVTNNGAFALYAGNTYGIYGIFRLLAADVVGNPIQVNGFRLELLGAGAVTFEVPTGTQGILQNPNGPIVIHPDQRFIVKGVLGTVGPVENQGTIDMTGPGDNYSYLGTAGAGTITNHGLIRTSATTSATGGYSEFDVLIDNAVDGTIQALSGRGCYFPAGLSNSGLLDLSTRCGTYAGTFTFSPSSVLRVRSSASGVTGIDSIASASLIDGTLDVVTDLGAPPVPGAPVDLITARGYPYNNQVFGSFSSVTGGTFSPTLGYSVVYTSGLRKIQLQTVSSVTDLVTSGLTASASGNVGDDVTVSWNTTAGSTTSTTFTDSVFLSSSPKLDASAVLVGRVTRTGTVTGGVARSGSVQIRVPATTPGPRYLVVVADSGNALAVGNRSGAVAALPFTVTAQNLNVGSPAGNVTVGADGTRTSGASTAPLEGTRLLRLNGGLGQDVIVTISPATAVSAWMAAGRLPGSTDFDVALTNGTILVPKGDGASERYVLLRNTGSAQVVVSVQATAPGLSITSTSPAAVLAGSPAATAVLVKGTGFTGSSVASLQCGATTVNAVSTQVDGPTQLTSLFNLPTALGTCDVKVGAATKAAALSVTAPPVAVNTTQLDVDIDVIVPPLLRSNVDNTITVVWTNRTSYSLPAPLFQVSVDHGQLRFPGSPATGGSSVEVLGIAPTGPAGILAPGASASTTLIVSAVPAHTEVDYEVGTVDGAAAYDFGLALVAGLGDDVPTAARTWVTTNGPLLLNVPRNTTVAGLAQHLRDVATTLSSLGRRVANPAVLLRMDLMRITGSGRLDGFRSGEFGVGEEGMALPRLSVETGTNDVILTDGDRRLRYSRRANGTYVSPPGDADLLTSAVGGWSLIARNGTKRSFSNTGQLLSVTDPDDLVITFGYTAGRLTTITDPNGDVVTYGYDGSGRVTSVTDAVGRVETFAYDGSGRMTTMVDNGITTSTTWTADNLTESITQPDGAVTSVTRDGFGRVLTQRLNGDLVSSTTYNADGSTTRTNALGQTTTMWLDDQGGVAKLVDADGRVTVVRRDAAGNAIGTVADGAPVGDVTTVDQRGTITGAVDGAGGRTAVAWDVDGMMRSLTDAEGRTTSFTRDAALRPTKVTDPAGASTTLTYDSAGRLTGTTDRSGRATTLTYDAKDLVTQRSVGGYGAVAYNYDAHRNLTSAVGPTGTTTFTYDSHDRLLTVSYPNGLGLTFTYDSAGRRTSVTTSDGQTTGATYDAKGRLATVTVGLTTVSTYEYDELDRLIAIRSANGSRTVITRDTLGRVTRQKTTCCTPNGASEGSTSVVDVQLTYDNLDRVLTRAEAGSTTTYAYDGAGRLKSAVTTGTGARTITYAYDRAGNRTSVVDSVAGTTASTYSAAGRLTAVGAQAVTHDAEGRQLSRGGNTYTWDGRGAFGSATVQGATTTYTYDALGTPISRTTNGVTTKLLMDPAGLGWLVAEYSGAGTRQAGYAWGQGIAAQLDGAGAVARYYATDPRGDVVALSDGAGAVTDTFRYLPFGEVATRTGSTTQPFGFGGNWGLRTEPTGLVNARARQYDPALGRFLSEDPLLFASSNAVTFASNDPINRTDVTGGADDFWSSMAADPVGYGAAALGINTDNGFDLLNPLQVSGLGLTGAGALLDNGTAALQVLSNSNAEGAAAWRNYANWAADNTWKGQAEIRNWQRGQQAAKALDAANKPINRTIANRTRTSKNMGRAGAALNFIQAGINIANPPDEIRNGDWVDKSAFVVRQIGLAGVKTWVGRVPFLDLAVDPLANVLEANALTFGWWCYDVDPSKLFNETHWKPEIAKKKKKNHSGSGDAWDPNEIVGPTGVTVGLNRYVAREDLLGYEIHYENLDTAVLPADEVTVTHTLDADLDLSTFELGAVTIGDTTFEAPPGQRVWSTLLDDRAQSGLYVRLKARLDLGTRVVTWVFTGVDPETLDRPADATLGFLPPNDTSPEGEGGVSYRVRASSSAPTGTAITAQASIVFDANPAILTNIDTVLLDAAPPTAAPSAPASSQSPVTVTLGATDDVGGSGVGSVDLWASADGGVYDRVATGLTGSTYGFTGDIGSTYRFRVVPSDAVGNEGSLSGASSQVLVTGPGGLVPVAAADSYLARVDQTLVVPATGVLANDHDPESVALTAAVVANPSHGSLTLNANGSFSYTPSGGYTGSDSFTYRASDGILQSSVTTVSLTVRPHGLEIGDIAVVEPPGTATTYAVFTVTLSKPYPTKVTVKATAVPGTALLGKDFRTTATTVTFKPGETSKQVKVRLVTDDVVEGAETFTVVLSKPVGAPIVDGTGVATIAADPPPPVVSINDAAAVTEPAGNARVEAVFTVTLSKAWGKTVTVRVGTMAGTATSGKDYRRGSATLTFKAGETTKTVKVRILRDALVEGVEHFTVVLSSPKRATIGDGSGLGTINAV